LPNWPVPVRWSDGRGYEKAILMARLTKKRSGRKWLQAARESMERRGTVGSFGKATRYKIARAKAKGGKQRKKAIFAQTMKRLAKRRKVRSRR
jgi:hypothetical protein